MWKRNQSKFGSTPIPETPYQKAGQVWDNRMGAAVKSIHSWKMSTFGALGLAALMGFGMIWQSAQASVAVHVVELDANGGVKSLTPLQGEYKPTDAQIANQLARFIKNVRSVSIDPVVLRENWMNAYNYATDQAALTLNAYANENDPFADIGQRSVTVDVISIVRSSGDSFEVRWRESNFRNGAQLGSQTYTASLAIITKAPTDAQTLHRNPLGLYVHGLNWSQDLQSPSTQQ